MTRSRNSIIIVSILLLSVGASFIVFGWTPFRLGLDLVGGTHLVYEGDLASIEPSDRGDAMNSVREVIERRVNAFGVTEPVVQVAGDNRLIVELPGVKDIQEAIKQIGLTPFLEFREVDPGYLAPADQTQIDVNKAFRPTGLSGKHLKRAEVVFDPNTNTPQISLQFNDEGADLFAQITARNRGSVIAIFLDGAPISAPRVDPATVPESGITSGEAVITGTFAIDEAKELAQRLNAGALPVPIKLLQQQNVGPSLGEISLRKSIAAGLIGFAVIALFMVVYYRLPGVFAVFALIIYILLSLAIFKIAGVTLTLAGITGFILSVGMAVDANILVFERLKEELRSGKELTKALDEAFRRAWSAIRDSNISSLITVFILAYFGTSLIRGFAITLGIGILTSMFTALTATRTLLRLFYSFRKN